jgi:hypothetical protein
MEKKQSWAQKNPQRIKEHKKRYYEKNLSACRRRSKAQNLRGKLSYLSLTDAQKKKIDAEVEKILASDI